MVELQYALQPKKIRDPPREMWYYDLLFAVLGSITGGMFGGGLGHVLNIEPLGIIVGVGMAGLVLFMPPSASYNVIMDVIN